MMNKIAVYKHTAAYAREHGELEQYRTSLQANIACKNAIEAAIRQHFDGMHHLLEQQPYSSYHTMYNR